MNANNKVVRKTSRIGTTENFRLKAAKAAVRDMLLLVNAINDSEAGFSLSQAFAISMMKVIGIDEFYINEFIKNKIHKSCVCAYGVDRSKSISKEDREVIASLDKEERRVYHILERENYQGESVSTYLFVPKNFFYVNEPVNGKESTKNTNVKRIIPINEYLTKELDTAARLGVKGYEVSKMGSIGFNQYITTVNLITLNGIPIRIN